MTRREEDIVWKLLFALALVNGDLACTISEDPEHRKWLAVTAKQTRDKLIKIQDEFMKEIGFTDEKT